MSLTVIVCRKSRLVSWQVAILLNCSWSDSVEIVHSAFGFNMSHQWGQYWWNIVEMACELISRLGHRGQQCQQGSHNLTTASRDWDSTGRTSGERSLAEHACLSACERIRCLCGKVSTGFRRNKKMHHVVCSVWRDLYRTSSIRCKVWTITSRVYFVTNERIWNRTFRGTGKIFSLFVSLHYEHDEERFFVEDR